MIVSGRVLDLKHIQIGIRRLKEKQAAEEAKFQRRAENLQKKGESKLKIKVEKVEKSKAQGKKIKQEKASEVEEVMKTVKPGRRQVKAVGGASKVVGSEKKTSKVYPSERSFLR